MSALLEKVRIELARYEHPLFDFSARPAPGGVEILIRFKFWVCLGHRKNGPER